ncbi:MAG TPA: VIT family protein [Steroidobacteraceae bacterium]|jgi:VIT1/CCC1 family predicted Fe2+/Mn2+ transporter|nr:VIT family protein [Steroidobacteraceae bacterium]
MPRRHFERHFVNRVGWLRAAVLGANDGIVSVGSLLVGVASTRLTRAQILVVGVAGLVAGAMSMAAGEFVSVSSQADSERADLERERHELEVDAAHEHAELAGIYVRRGLTPALAQQVAAALMAHDALAAHARDELGLSMTLRPRPIQAALASGGSFTAGAVLSLLLVGAAPAGMLVPVIALGSLLLLGILGGVAARAGGAPVAAGVGRVTLWGALAMALTAAAGSAFNAFG